MSTDYLYEETDSSKIGSAESPAINKLTNILIDILKELRHIK